MSQSLCEPGGPSGLLGVVAWYLVLELAEVEYWWLAMAIGAQPWPQANNYIDRLDHAESRARKDSILWRCLHMGASSRTERSRERPVIRAEADSPGRCRRCDGLDLFWANAMPEMHARTQCGYPSLSGKYNCYL